MKTGRAARWAARIFKWEEDSEGCTKFLDWGDFRSEFHKEFCPTNSDTAAVNKLESMAYYQGPRSVDDYLDEFLDLIAESGYTDPKNLVVKFRRGLDPQIQDAVATMISGRSSDIVSTAWYEAAKNIDQNRASNEAFCSAYHTLDPLTDSLPPSPIQPICCLPTFNSLPKQQTNGMPLLSSHNRFNVLHVEQVNDTQTETPDVQKLENLPTSPPITNSYIRTRHPKWERLLPEKFIIAATSDVPA
jgi:hypothetical protein